MSDKIKPFLFVSILVICCSSFSIFQPSFRQHLRAYIVNNPFSYLDSVQICLINNGEDSLLVNSDLTYEIAYNDSLIFEQDYPITNSVFCNPPTNNQKARICFLSIPPNSKRLLTLNSTVWNKSIPKTIGNKLVLKFIFNYNCRSHKNNTPLPLRIELI
jgi:hypothetical protein